MCAIRKETYLVIRILVSHLSNGRVRVVVRVDNGLRLDSRLTRLDKISFEETTRNDADSLPW